MLHTRDLNRIGILIYPNGFEWVTVDSELSSVKTLLVNLELQDDGTLKGNTNFNLSGYYRVMFNDLEEDEGIEDNVKKRWFKDMIDFEIDSINVKNIKENIDDPIDFDIYYTIPGYAIRTDSLMLFNPMVIERYHKNPLTLDERKFPVDLAFKEYEKVVVKIKFPENMIVASMPEIKSISLPGDKGRFRRLIEANEEGLTMMSEVRINQRSFSNNEYHTLKEFFQQIVDLQSEEMILKFNQ